MPELPPLGATIVWQSRVVETCQNCVPRWRWRNGEWKEPGPGLESTKRSERLVGARDMEVRLDLWVSNYLHEVLLTVDCIMEVKKVEVH
jgi:hypothetical protein